MAKNNPLKLNALQLKTLVLLQQMARSPNHAQPVRPIARLSWTTA